MEAYIISHSRGSLKQAPFYFAFFYVKNHILTVQHWNGSNICSFIRREWSHTSFLAHAVFNLNFHNKKPPVGWFFDLFSLKFFKEAFALGIGILANGFCKLTEKLLLLFGKVFRNLDIYLYKLVTAA